MTSKLTVTITDAPSTASQSTALTAVADTATDNKPNLTVVLLNEIWQKIFAYAGTFTCLLLRRVEPGFHYNVTRMELDSEIATISSKEEIEQMAVDLAPNNSEKSNPFKELAVRRTALTTARQGLEKLEMEGKLTADALLIQASTLKSDLIEALKGILKAEDTKDEAAFSPAAPSNFSEASADMKSLWNFAMTMPPVEINGEIPSTLALFHIARIKGIFQFQIRSAVHIGHIHQANKRLCILPSKLNMGTLHHRWIAKVEDRTKRLNLIDNLICEYVLQRDQRDSAQPEKAIVLLQNEGRELPFSQKISRLRIIVSLFLKQRDAYAWDLLRLQTPPVVTVEELEQANKCFSVAEAFLKSGDVPEACRIARDHLISIDPMTNIMRFPDQCLRFLELLINVPKETLSKFNPIPEHCLRFLEHLFEVPKETQSKFNPTATLMSAAAAASATAPPEETFIESVVANLIMHLPDEAKKAELLKKAQDKKIFQSFPAVTTTIKHSLEALEIRELNLYNLAIILLKDQDFKRFDAIANRLGPPLVFACLNELLDIPNFFENCENDFFKLANTLPDEYKCLLIDQATKKKCPKVVPLLEASFDRVAFWQRAEKEFQIELKYDLAFSLLFGIMQREGVTTENVDRLLLLAWDPIFENTELFDSRLASKFNENYKKTHPLLNDAIKQLNLFFQVKRILITPPGADDAEALMKFIAKLPPILKVGILRLLKGKFPKMELTSILEKDIEALGKDVKAKCEEEHRRLTVVCSENILLPSNPRDAIMKSNLMPAAFIISRFEMIEKASIRENITSLIDNFAGKAVKEWPDFRVITRCNGIEVVMYSRKSGFAETMTTPGRSSK